jgi:hypothetical protein
MHDVHDNDGLAVHMSATEANPYVGQLFAGGGVRVWNEVFGSRSPAPPIERADPRWKRCGVSFRRPRFHDLGRVYAVLSEGSVSDASPRPP